MQIENIAKFILSAAYLTHHILWRLKQENREIKANLRYTMRPNLWGKRLPFLLAVLTGLFYIHLSHA